MLVFVSMFGFAGIALLAFLWGPTQGPMEPPWIFRVMGSLIALMFIAMGFGVPITAYRASAQEQTDTPETTPATPDPAKAGYRCHNCGAALGPEQEVSPSGDVKCAYCKRWWNIHRSSA